jgi:UDP-glucose 4-epimerase
MRITKAFVTGGAGFIGSHVTDGLLEKGISVVIYDNLSTGRREFVPSSKKATFIEGDVLDLENLRKSMEGCDAVFHFQANADVRGGKVRTRVDLEQNTIATWNVLEAMRLNSVPLIAFASSSAIYGEPEVFPTPESYAPTQTSLYGASKLAGEAMIQAYCEYYGMRCFLFRFVSWIGERYSHGVIFDFLKKLKQNPRQLDVLGDGQQRKSYLYVKDGVSGILRAVAEAADSKNVFNLGHHEYVTVVELARILFDEAGLKNVEMRFTGEKRGWVGDSPLVHLDTTKISRLGWKPETSIEEGIRRTVRFLAANPEILNSRQ